MARSLQLCFMISIRRNNWFPPNGNCLSLALTRQRLKEAVEEQDFLRKKSFEAWIDEEAWRAVTQSIRLCHVH